MAAILALSGCASGVTEWSTTQSEQEGTVGDLTVIRLDASNVAAYSTSDHATPSGGNPPTDTAEWRYLVGPGDILTVLVFNHPELSMPAGEGGARGGAGFRVREDGTIFYPFVGELQAAGRAPEEIRRELSERLAEYITDPQVELRVASFNSQSINLTGAAAGGSRQPITDVRLRLIDAVNAAGGLPPSADASRVALHRGGRSYTVNLQAFLEGGARGGNPTLIGGDVVHIPEREPAEVFLMGEIVRPDSIDIGREQVSLTQALARQGGIERVRADAEGVFVFRRAGTQYTVFQLAVNPPSGFLLGGQFALHPGDVVYVTRAPLQAWNDTLRQILPTVSAIPTTNSAANTF